jgi:predicted acetyltransferase
MEIRPPTEDERDQVVSVLRASLNLPRANLEERGPMIPLSELRCALDGDRVVSVAGGRSFRQWFGGHELPMSGIWGVGTLPEHRGTGLASRAIGQILTQAREDGVPLSVLYPATLRPYRRLGYELAGTFTEHRVPLDDLPRMEDGSGSGSGLGVVEYDPAHDLEDVRACYRRSIGDANGPIDSDSPAWWPQRIMGFGTKEQNHRAVVARGPDGIEAYASFVLEKAPGDLDVSFLIECRHFVFSTTRGLGSILAYFRGFRGLGQALQFTGPPADPLAVLVEEQRVKPEWIFRWMLRLLDVPGALTGRGYPPVSGEAVIAVDDEMFPDNHGPWTVRADGGAVTITPADAGVSPQPIGIGTLSSMYSGYLSPFDAVRLGLLDSEDPAVPFLAKLFSGSAPWMHDFF